MDKKQKINCTVESCIYNDKEGNECNLDTIIVTPTKGCNTGKSNESKCSSYKNN